MLYQICCLVQLCWVRQDLLQRIIALGNQAATTTVCDLQHITTAS